MILHKCYKKIKRCYIFNIFVKISWKTISWLYNGISYTAQYPFPIPLSKF